MSIRTLRSKKNLSQEQLAETTGLSLRTIQRIESGDSVSQSSWRTLAAFFNMSTESLMESNLIAEPLTAAESRLGQHRAIQLIIFVVTFFVCVSQWLAYLAYLNPGNESADLWQILTIISEIAFAAAIFAYLFTHSKITFVWSYYATAAAFLIVAIALDFWTSPDPESASRRLLYPVFFSLMLLSLLVIHVLQMALSLKGESVILSQR